MEYNNFDALYKNFCEFKNDNFVIEKDALSNIIFHSEGSEKRILVYPVFELQQLMIKKVNDKEAKFEAIGRKDASVLKDREVFCDGISVGIIREKKEDENKSVYYAELWEKDSVKEGDLLQESIHQSCKDNLLYSNNICINIAEYLCKKLISKKFKCVNEIYFTVCFDINSALFAANRIDADIILPVYAAEAGDTFEPDKGCGLVLKDGGFVLRSDQRNFFEDNYFDSDCSIQAYVGSQCPVIERLSLLCRGQVYPIAIPAKHLGSYSEIVSSKDIDSAAELIYNILNTEVKHK